MGQYVITNAPSINEVADFIGEPPSTATWGRSGTDVVFVDTALSDAECAALYVGYIPSGLTDDQYVPPPPAAVQDAITALTALWNLNPETLTSAQSATFARNVLIVMRYLWKSTMVEG